MRHQAIRQGIRILKPLYDGNRVRSEWNASEDAEHFSLTYEEIILPGHGRISVQERQTIEKKLSSFYARIGKPILDYVMAVVLIAILSPSLLFIAVLVKINSRGSVIFRQKRIGLNNRPFMMYKFRSMYADSPAYSLKPCSSSDPRITPVGRWLRKASLDELPQLFNVLKGDMSLIGPRPEMSFLAREYNELENQRHLAKPGITGLWQLSPGRSLAIRDGIHWDLQYIENLSFLNDLKILFRTFKVFRGGNTY